MAEASSDEAIICDVKDSTAREQSHTRSDENEEEIEVILLKLSTVRLSRTLFKLG